MRSASEAELSALEASHRNILRVRLIPAMQEHLRFMDALRQLDSARAAELLKAHINSEWTLPPQIDRRTP